jgi:serine/threonine protein phosphatase PrpC
MPTPHHDLAFAVKSQATRESGLHPNEDIFGVEGNFAWIFDGATSASPSQQGASELVLALSDGIREAVLAGDTDLRQIGKRGVDAAIQRLKTDSSKIPPSAAGLICKLQGDIIEYLVLGDVTMIVSSQKSISIVRDPSSLQREVSYLTEAKTSQRSLGDVLDKRRRGMNTEAGYWIWSVSKDAVDKAYLSQFVVSPDSWVLLASDGFLRLVDLFKNVSYDELMLLAINKGCDSIIDMVRELESEDADCSRFSRASVCDDASGLLLEVVDNERFAPFITKKGV